MKQSAKQPEEDLTALSSLNLSDEDQSILPFDSELEALLHDYTEADEHRDYIAQRLQTVSPAHMTGMIVSNLGRSGWHMLRASGHFLSGTVRSKISFWGGAIVITSASGAAIIPVASSLVGAALVVTGSGMMAYGSIRTLIRKSPELMSDFSDAFSALKDINREFKRRNRILEEAYPSPNSVENDLFNRNILPATFTLMEEYPLDLTNEDNLNFVITHPRDNLLQTLESLTHKLIPDSSQPYTPSSISQSNETSPAITPTEGRSYELNAKDLTQRLQALPTIRRSGSDSELRWADRTRPESAQYLSGTKSI